MLCWIPGLLHSAHDVATVCLFVGALCRTFLRHGVGCPLAHSTHGSANAALLLLLAPLLANAAACCQASLYGGLGTAAVLAVCTQLSYKQFQEKKPVSQPVTAVSLGVSAAVTVGMLHSCKAIGEHNKLAVAGAVLSTAFTGWCPQLVSAVADMVVVVLVVVLLLLLLLPSILPCYTIYPRLPFAHA